MSQEPSDAALRPQQFQALLEVSEAITRHGDLDELFQDLAQRLRRVVPFDFITVLLHDDARDVMRLHILTSDQPRVRTGPDTHTLDSPGGQVWATQEPMVIPDYEQETRFPLLIPVWRDLGLRSGCYLPLTTARRRLGAINFASARPRTYDPGDLWLFEQVARQAAVAVDNALNAEAARCYQQKLADERDRLRVLLEVNNAVVAHLDLQELFHTIAACLRRVVGHEYASLALYDEARRQFRVHALDFPGSKGLLREEYLAPVEGAPAGKAFRSGRPVVLSEEDLKRLDSEIARILLAEGVRSQCCVPLISHGRALGTLNFGRLDGQPFEDSEVQLLVQVAGQIALAVDNALAFRQIAELKDKLAEEKLYLEDEIRTEYQFAEIIGASPAVQRILRQVEVVAPSDTTVLIQGETGTGKELIARAIHRLSGRRERTFIKLNCAAIPTGLLESELFGHERGAFTGAIAQKIGRFEVADKGTLFLDEIGDIPLELQPKLLRVLQEQEFERLGSTRTVRVDVRILAATNRDLAQMVAERQFRSDLFYRLNVFPLTLPPLRERPEDIPLLVRYFVQEHARRLGRTIESIPTKALNALVAYPWPGNVRELENFIERSVLLSRGPELHVPVDELRSAAAATLAAPATLDEAEREHILQVLKQTNWVIGGPAGAAARLGMKRTTLLSRMKKLGIRRPR
jgi:formate hydrogenlyase transcriptional activator